MIHPEGQPAPELPGRDPIPLEARLLKQPVTRELLVGEELEDVKRVVVVQDVVGRPGRLVDLVLVVVQRAIELRGAVAGLALGRALQRCPTLGVVVQSTLCFSSRMALAAILMWVLCFTEPP